MNDIIFGDAHSTWKLNLFKSEDFIVSNIDNLTWGGQELSLQTTPYLNGDIVANNRGLSRDITIELKPKKDTGNFTSILNAIMKLIGQDVYLTWKNQECDGTTSDWNISGIVSEVETPRFNDDVRASVTIHCADPYWYGSAQNVSSVDGYVTIKGTAPTKVNVFIPNATIPSTNVTLLTGTTPPALRVVGGSNLWYFNTPGTTVTGNMVITTNDDTLIEPGYEPITVAVNSVKRYDLMQTPLRAMFPSTISCVYWHPDHTNEGGTYSDLLDFSVRYRPRYY